MNIAFALAVYFVLWWLVLFVMLPVGVRTQDDEGEIVPGTASSAPVSPQIGKKALLTTLISAAIFGGVYGLIALGVLDLNALLFGR